MICQGFIKADFMSDFFGLGGETLNERLQRADSTESAWPMLAIDQSKRKRINKLTRWQKENR